MSKTNPVNSDIHGRERLDIKNTADLRAYYEAKYSDGGYSDGVVIHGVRISRLYHEARFDSAMRFLERLPAKAGLDVGCGAGDFSIRMASRVSSVTAVDIADNAFLSAAAANPNITFAQMNAEALSFKDGTFDVVTCIETIEHLLNPTQALNEMSRVLKKNGHLILSYPLINVTSAKRYRLAPILKISEHLNEWTYQELMLNIRTAGLFAEDIEGLVFDFGYLNAIKYLGRWPCAWLTKLSLRIRSHPENSMFVVLLLKKA